MLVRGTPAPQMPKPMSPDTALPNPLLPLPPPRPIRLLLHGQPREISGVPPTRSLLERRIEDPRLARRALAHDEAEPREEVKTG